MTFLTTKLKFSFFFNYLLVCFNMFLICTHFRGPPRAPATEPGPGTAYPPDPPSHRPCSQPYIATRHTSALISHNLVPLLTDLFFHTLTDLTIIAIPLTSFVQSAFFGTLHLKYTKAFTCTNLFAPTSISSTSSAFVIVFV